jgi:hypothetical protein
MATESGVYRSHELSVFLRRDSSVPPRAQRFTAIVAIEGQIRENVARTVIKRIVRAVAANPCLGQLVVAAEDREVARVAEALGAAAVVVTRDLESVGRLELVAQGLKFAEARFGACDYVAILGTDFDPKHGALIDAMARKAAQESLDTVVVTRTRMIASLVSSSMRPSFLVFELACLTRPEFVRQGEYVGPRLVTCDAPPLDEPRVA